ncbi:MAG: cryptochrome/photolyase family protein [Candidatus Parcubacteria bacterium]|nr:cryptochrome/photolyase family protein [Candidatus Paceibacterota bacterium]
MATSPKNITLILGDQLYHNHPALEIETNYVMLESKDFNTEFLYHKARILYCFVAMREYADHLISLDKTVDYYRFDKQIDLEMLFDILAGAKHGYTDIYIVEVDDKGFKKTIIELAQKFNLNLHWLVSPKFLTRQVDWNAYRTKHAKGLRMNDFYIMQRRRLGLFIDNEGNSSLGKWSLDEENRKKIPKTETVIKRPKAYQSRHEIEAKKLIETHFCDNYGSLSGLYFPVNRPQALELLEEFGKLYFEKFGIYEDALTARDPFLFHSTISPLLNNGLLTPQEVVDWVMRQNHIPDNSREGFIRQIIGWREWVNCLYWNVYRDNLVSYNFFGNHKKLPNYFWDKSELGSIQSNLPLYNALASVFDYAYCHHIERLMVISNWMTLNEYDPMECYEWFMTMFIDSYSWVMVANVLGMGLYADGGIFATKPYVAGGNYLKKMSDYPSGKGDQDWEKLWTDKFWDFVLKHEQVFAKNPRMNMLIVTKKKKML